MNIERLNQIEEIYHAALQLAAAERETFLDASCGDDADLRREVESLLDFEKSPHSISETVPGSLVAELFGNPEKTPELIGKKIAHYQIIRLLGKGGMGEVFLAEDLKLSRRVALKCLPPEFAANQDRMNRFVREAKAASALNHPNIITIHEINEFEGTHFIATEYIDGQTLKAFSKVAPLSVEAVLEIAVQIASGLAEAHSAGIIHRDVKPDNVMIRTNGLVKILDFGIAKLLENESEKAERSGLAASAGSTDTSPGIIIGTTDYMSPEQAKSREIDVRTDIFSFGVVLYEMLAGRLPFEGGNAFEVIGAILHKEPKAFENDEIPSDVRRIVDQCLIKDRDERYQTINDVLFDLQEAKRSFPVEKKSRRPAFSTVRDRSDTDPRPAETTGEITRTNEIVTRSPKLNRLPVLVMAILLVAAAGFTGYRFLTAEKQIKSIAVMPFANDSGNPDFEYLSDGMTESLIAGLSQVPDLNVKARSSVFRYKGKEMNAQTIGRDLNVQAVLNGRVSQRGEQLILGLELVDTVTENVIWSQQYVRKQADIVMLQSDIARDVSGKLKIKISGSEAAKVTKNSTDNPEAYQAYLKGVYYWNRRTEVNLQKSIDQFKAAIDNDPNYALAYVGLADGYIALNSYAGTPLSETVPQTRDYIERALAIDDRLAEPHAALGKLNNQLWQWAESEREFKLAIELNPNYASAYHWYSLLLRDLGRYEEAAVMIKRAQELDPLSSVIGINVSQIYLIQGKYDESIDYTQKILELDPNFPGAYTTLGLAYLRLGRNAEALANIEKAVDLSNRAAVVLRTLGYALALAGKRTEALAIARELEEKYKQKQALGQVVAAVYAGLDDREKTFEWLEKAFQEKEDLGGIRWNLQFEALHDDPRFKGLLKRMDLPE